MVNIAQLKKDRYKYLNHLYNKVSGSTGYMINMFELGKEIQFEDIYTRDITSYLINEGLIQRRALGGGISITHYGVKEIEEANTYPDKPTQYFPPVQNIINIQSMHHSAIQQGSTNSTQNFTISNQNIEAIKEFIKGAFDTIEKLHLSEEQESELRAELETIKSQLSSPKPKKSILNEALHSTRTILEGITVELAKPYASSLLLQIGALLS